MKKIYCGGRFNFDYLDEGYRMEAAKDYRAVLLGNEELLLKRSKSVKINEYTEYIGPFYFESDGMLDIDIVKNESDMVINCTDAIFLLDDACCPGTVCELTAASMLGKRVHIFYLKRSDTEETESSLHTPCWYPIIYSILANNRTRIYECENFGDAVAKICGMVNEWQR